MSPKNPKFSVSFGESSQFWACTDVECWMVDRILSSEREMCLQLSFLCHLLGKLERLQCTWNKRILGRQFNVYGRQHSLNYSTAVEALHHVARHPVTFRVLIYFDICPIWWRRIFLSSKFKHNYYRVKDPKNFMSECAMTHCLSVEYLRWA